ncbi:MAG: DUF2341 domain-containing protein, partial [Bacteroidota bacterium]
PIRGLYSCSVPWWNASYNYRTNISIESNISSLINNSIALVNFSTTSLISQGRMRSDCWDTRFTDNNGVELQYTLETSTCNSSNTIYWVWGNWTGNANTTIWAYYGNSNASLKTDYSNPDSSLVLYMHFDNSSAYGETDSKTYDFSKKGNNGTVTGTAITKTPFGKGRNIATSGHKIDAGNGASLQIRDQITMSAWINTTYTAGYGRVVGKDDSTNRCYGMEVAITTGTISGGVFIGNVWKGAGSSRVVTDGNWHNVVITYDGSNVRFFIDGVQDGSDVPASGQIDNDAVNVVIGSYAAGTPYTFIGNIDEVRIYNRSLSLNEIQAYYNSTKPYFIQNETLTKTNSTGHYNYTFTAPSTPGIYVFKINSTYGSEYGEQTQYLTADAFPLISSTAYIPTKVYYDTTAGALSAYITATVTDAANDLTSVNFTVTAPNGTNVIYNINASNNIGSTWNSIAFYLNQYGQWNYSISARDINNNTNNATGNINFLQITESLNASVVNQNSSVTVSGHINDSRMANVGDNAFCLYINNSPITGLYNCLVPWWNTSFSYRKNISTDSGVASSITNSIVSVNFSTTSLISQGMMRSDCGDTRFVNANNVELQYTLETSTCNSTNTIYWVWGNWTGNANTTIWTYYGNQITTLKTDYTNPDKSLIVYYHFDNSSAYGETNSNIFDFSKYNNNGTAASTTIVAGKFGKAVKFGGSGSSVKNTNLVGPSNLSIVLWLNTSSSDLDQNWHNLIGWNYDGANINGIWIYQNKTIVWSATGANSQHSTVLEKDRWYHIAFTFDGTTRTIYVDGVNQSFTAGFAYTTNTFSIGSVGTTNYFSNSMVDEVKIFNRTLTKNEILALYNSTKPYFIQNETLTKTNSTGHYVYSFTAPSEGGGYFAKINSTYGTEYGEQTQYLTVDAFPLVSSTAYIPTK